MYCLLEQLGATCETRRVYPSALLCAADYGKPKHYHVSSAPPTFRRPLLSRRPRSLSVSGSDKHETNQSGCLGRARAKRARARRAPLLESRRLHAIAEQAVHDGRFEEAARCLTEVG